ncbi:hypothetical protein OROGR_018734 [Orobanche gracilis]
MIKMNIKELVELESGHHLAKNGELSMDAANEKPFMYTRMGPCAETEAMDSAGDIKSVQVTDDILDLNCSAGVLTKQVPLPEIYGKDHVLVDTELKYCSTIQLKESDNCVEAEHPGAKEILSSAELELVKDDNTEALKEHCMIKLENEEHNDSKVELKVKEAPNRFALELCTKNGTREPNNDDIHSEVSNPNPSPKNVTSSLTSSSQIDVVGSDHGGCGEITSVCCRSSHADETVCEEEPSNNKFESVSKACVVLEIPKHVRPTGVRKITFKFSKREEGYDADLSASVKHLGDDKLDERCYDNKLSKFPTGRLTGTGFQNQGWSTLENRRNLGMDGMEFHDTQSPSSCVPNRELKMSKKIVPDNYPTNVNKLLSTGILEGARVKYISISGMKEVPGIIRGGGYLCGCCACNFSKVVSSYEFEIHAGAKTRHPNNHVYLENGKPIYSIIEELRTAPLSTIDNVIKSMAGSSVNEEYFRAWKANLQNDNGVAYTSSVCQSRYIGMSQSTTSQFSEECPYPASSYVTPFNQPSYIESPVKQKRPVKKPRHSYWEQKKVGEGGNKKRDNDLHKLLFMPNGLPDGTSLAYYSKGKKILGGYKQGNGIVCSCCNCEISPSQFEAHAGWAAKRQPYRHIYTSSGLTLHDIALMLANGQKITSSGSDDMCAVCGDRGELVICSGCPRAFHAACLGLQCLPPDDWHCSHCRERFGPGRKTSAGSKHIILRLKRVVQAPEFEPGGCVICRSQDFSAGNFDDRTVIICDQCEKEYHVGCLRESELCDLKELPEDKWFCRDDCHSIFEALQNLACHGPEVIPDSVSATVYEKQANLGLNTMSKNEIQWCILNGKSRFPEHMLLLSRAAAIFRECFDPIVAKSGRDLIPVMVYGSVVVSAALLRIFGKHVAELPLVATSRENQGKGYFQALFSCIERFLSSLCVKHLVLPAAEEAEPMWTHKLGFRKTSNEQHVAGDNPKLFVGDYGRSYSSRADLQIYLYPDIQFIFARDRPRPI